LDSIICAIFCFITIPLIYTVFFLDSRSRTLFICVIVGMAICLISSEINSLCLSAVDNDFFYLSTTISPIVEETMKGLPMLFLVFFWFDGDKLNEYAVACGATIGVGFALFENIVSFFQNNADVSVTWIIARAIGSGIVHGICTAAVGLGLAIIKNEKRKYLFSIIGLMTAVFIYHSLYNCFIQTETLQIFGIIMPTVTFIIFFLLFRYNRFANYQVKRLLNDKNVIAL